MDSDCLFRDAEGNLSGKVLQSVNVNITHESAIQVRYHNV